MRSTLQKISAILGLYAGILGVQHGIFEVLQGNVSTGSLLINAIGNPCQSTTIWHACFPALTIIPNFLITGILAVIIGLIVIIWAIFFIQQKFGGIILIVLSIMLVVVGGGFVSSVICLIAGVAGSRNGIKPINQTNSQSIIKKNISKLWPWLLIIMGIWLPGSWILGYLFGQIMLSVSVILFLTMDIGIPILTVISGFISEELSNK